MYIEEAVKCLQVNGKRKTVAQTVKQRIDVDGGAIEENCLPQIAQRAMMQERDPWTDQISPAAAPM
jgi:hypothetical protein